MVLLQTVLLTTAVIFVGGPDITYSDRDIKNDHAEDRTTLPPGVDVYRGPVFNPNTTMIDFMVKAPRYQMHMGDWGAGVHVVLPETAMTSAKRGKNATSDPSSFRAIKSILLVLPVTNGPTSDDLVGSGIQLVQAYGYQNSAGAIVATPDFTVTPWFCDGIHSNATEPPSRQASYIREVIVPLLQMYCPGGDCPVDLMGFSKSGWGALSLLVTTPSIFRRAAIWDAPNMLSLKFCHWMMSWANESSSLYVMMEDIGNCEVWAKCAPHEVVSSTISNEFKLPNPPRIFLSGQHYFGNYPSTRLYEKAPGSPFNHTVDMHSRMQQLGVAHVYNDSLDPGYHEWSDAWMKPALEFLSKPL